MKTKEIPNAKSMASINEAIDAMLERCNIVSRIRRYIKPIKKEPNGSLFTCYCY